MSLKSKIAICLIILAVIILVFFIGETDSANNNYVNDSLIVDIDGVGRKDY